MSQSKVLKGFWNPFSTCLKIIRLLLGKRPGQSGCIYIPERVINRPDPCIYSQFLLMQLKLPVTWDNPDVALFLGGIEQFTYDLTTDTRYDVLITVHNSSRDKQALGTKVDVRWIEFGAGAQIRHPITIEPISTDVPVWPGTSQISVLWTTPSTPGHYCIEVELSHPNDGNPANNRGWNNTQVKAAHSQVQSEIRIFNQRLNASAEGTPQLTASDQAMMVSRPPRRNRNHVDLSVDSYVFLDAVGKDANPDDMFAPREAVWSARVEPSAFDFEPEEAFRDVVLIVDAPNESGTLEAFNVTAWQDDIPIGGVTVTVKRE